MRREEGYIQKISEYIRRNLSKGYTMESLKWALINQGYPKVEVDKAINLANQELAKQAPVLKEKPQITVETIPSIEEKPSFWNKVKGFFK